MLNFHIFFVCRAKARPSKKARMNKLSEDQVVLEPEQTGEPDQTVEPEGPNPEATFDEPPPQHHNIDEQPEVDTAVPDAELADPIRASPVRATETPSTPEKAAGDKECEVTCNALDAAIAPTCRGTT